MKKMKKKAKKRRMLATEHSILEIKADSKEKVLKKITNLLDKYPGSLKLAGGVNMHTSEDEDDILLDFDMERPDTQGVRESFTRLPDSAKFDGLLLLTTHIHNCKI